MALSASTSEGMRTKALAPITGLVWDGATAPSPDLVLLHLCVLNFATGIPYAATPQAILGLQ